jgi:hypothetical protein
VSSQRPASRWLPPIDPKWVVIAVALCAVAWVLVAPRFLPFQDIPNHIHLLEIDREIGTRTDYLVRSDIHTLGYSLYIWISRLCAPVLSVPAVLRLLVLCTAIATPLAVGAVARALGISMGWAILLALPLGLSWPARGGLVPYALAIPPALMAVAAALGDDARGRNRWARLELMLWATLTYLAHAYVFGCLVFVLLAAWATVNAFSRRALITTTAAIAPGVVLALHDLRQHAFDPIAATQVTLFHAPRWYRPIGLALSHLVTRSYAITGPALLLAFLPLLALLLVAAVLAATGIGDIPRRGGRTFLIVVACAGSLGTLAIPESQGLVFLLASRTLVLGAIFWTLLAASAADRARGARAVLFAAAPLFALSASLAEVSRRAHQVEEVVGRDGPERLEGRYLTAQIPDCANASSLVWGGYDSFRHLWAYALGKRGVTPYLFSASRYQPIWYRSDTFRDLLRGPPEHPMNENELPLEPEACGAVGRERLLSATSWAEYDGVIVTKAGGGLDDALTEGRNRVVRRLAPGMALVVGPPPGPRAFVDFGTPHARARLAEGWSGDEIVDERTVVWSNGRSSTVSLVIEPSDTQYVLTWQAKGITAQAVSVTLNGRELGEVPVRDSWDRLHLFVDRGVLENGTNRLTFNYATTVKPEVAGDRRELAMLVDDLLLEPMGDPNVLTFGSLEARPHLLSGWARGDAVAGVPEATAISTRARIGLMVRRLPRRTRLRLVGNWPADRRVAISLNHRSVGFLSDNGVIAEGGGGRSVTRTAELVVGPGALVTGWNELELSNGSAENDAPLDLSLRRLELEGVRVSPLEIALGTADDRPFLAGGFSNPETIDGDPVVTTQGDGSALRFAFDLPASEHYLLSLPGRTAQPSSANDRTGDARLVVTLNGHNLASFDYGPNWTLASAVLGAEVRAALAGSEEHLLELHAVDASGNGSNASDGARQAPRPVMLRDVLLMPLGSSDEVDVGHPPHLPRLRHGWSGSETIEGRTAVWTDGPGAAVVFYLYPDASDYELDWTAHAYAPIAPNSVRLVMNGHRWGRMEVPADWSTGTVRVPRSVLKPGANVLELEPSRTAQPAKAEQGSRDERQLGVMFDRLALRPATAR